MCYRKGVVLSVVVLLSVAAFPLLAAGEVSLNLDTAYSGGDENADQAVDVTVTLSPEGSKISDVRLQFQETQSAFIDYSTFTKKVEPADSDVTVQSTNQQGVFHVNELNPGETITITFEAYPRNIKQTSLDVATVEMTYVQNGQELSASQTATADLSSSPWFKYKEAQGGADNPFRLGIAIVIGVLLGAVIAFVAVRTLGSSGKEETDTTEREILDDW